jgi:hypothetical protein
MATVGIRGTHDSIYRPGRGQIMVCRHLASQDGGPNHLAGENAGKSLKDQTCPLHNRLVMGEAWAPEEAFSGAWEAACEEPNTCIAKIPAARAKTLISKSSMKSKSA